MFVAPCLSRQAMDCTGFAPIPPDRIKDVCSAAADYIQEMQENETAKYLERRRERANQARWFWAHLPWVSFREKTTEDIKAELDDIIKHGSVSEAISVMGKYPLDTTSQTWKEKAQRLLTLARDTKKAVYVNADDWEVIVRFARKNNAFQEAERKANN